MLTPAQIEAFRQRARAKGFSEAQINAEIARKQQESAKLQVQRAEKPAPIVTTPTSVAAAPSATKSKNIFGRVAEAVTKPAVEYGKFVAEAGAQAARYATDPTFRKVIRGQNLTEQERAQADRYKETFFVKPEQIKNRAKIVETGARRTAGAASYAVPGGTGIRAAAKAGAVVGGLSAFSQDKAGVADIATGAATGGVIGGAAGATLKALRSEAAKRVGTFLKNKGKDIQLSTYTRSLGKPSKAEGGRDLLVRMKKVGIRPGDPDAVVEQANRMITDEGNLVYQATRELGKKGVQIPVNRLTYGLRRLITSAKSTVTKKPLQEVLDTIETDLAGATTISPEDLYLLKTEYGGLGRWSSLSSAVEKKQAEAWREVYIRANKLIDNALKTGGFKDFRAINERLHTAIQASQYAARSGNVAPSRYNVGLYDYLSGIGAITATGNPLAGIAGVGIKKAVESPQASNVIGRILERAGQVTGGIGGVNVRVPQAAINTGIVGATQSPLLVGDEGDETYGEYGKDKIQQDGLLGETSISQGVAPHPIFGNESKQEVLLAAFKAGLNDKQLSEIETVYDRFAPEEAKAPERATTEKERAFQNAAVAAQQALDLLESGTVKSGIGQGLVGKVGEKLGTNTPEQQRYRSTLALARTAARNAMLGANMTAKEMESLQAFIPEFDDAPEVAKEKLATFVDLMNQFSGIGNLNSINRIESGVKKKLTPTDKTSFLKDLPEGISKKQASDAFANIEKAISQVNPLDPPEVSAATIGDVVFGSSTTEFDKEGNITTHVTRTPVNEYIAEKLNKLFSKAKGAFGQKTVEIRADQVAKESPEPTPEVQGVQAEAPRETEIVGLPDATEEQTSKDSPARYADTKSTQIVVKSGGQGQPTKDVSLPKDISRAITRWFGRDRGLEAARVLHHPYGEQVKDYGQGENAGFKVSDIDIPNYVDNKPEKGIKQVYNPFTDSMEDSIDRGLFRINNATFYTYLNSPERRELMKNLGIIDTTDLAKLDWKTEWDKMNQLEHNVAMAKIINYKQGWGAWFAAPIDLK